ncbi:MAG: hypothetical protein V4733_01610 [Verrucomicrobiota bacterium]
MKFLLGATIALLLGAFAVSWQSMKRGVSGAPDDEGKKIRKQIAELKQEEKNLNLQKEFERRQAAAPPVSLAPPESELEAMKKKIAAQEAEMAALDAEKKDRDKNVERDEEGLLAQLNLEKGDKELKRARMIANALLVAKVREFVKEQQFITFDVLMPEANIQPGTILGVRRKTGIPGTFKVTEISGEGGIANPMPGFGPFEPQPGDELILPPQY